MIIAIDGPGGAGKSTVARAVAARLGYAFLDTGALYRATALASMRANKPATSIVRDLDIRLGERILLDGEDVTEIIRTPSVTRLTHRIATEGPVRTALTEKQRSIIHRGNWVAEGRDIGTVVAPDADVKVFLTASLDVRARRRAHETGRPVAEVANELLERDTRDAEREHSPLAPAPDAVVIDASAKSIEGVIQDVLALVPLADHGRPALFPRTAEDALQARQRGQRRAFG